MQDFKVNCPCCDDLLLIKIEDNEISSIELVNNTVELSEKEAIDIARKHNIEFG